MSRDTYLYCNEFAKPLHHNLKEVMEWREKRYHEERCFDEAKRYYENNQSNLTEMLNEY